MILHEPYWSRQAATLAQWWLDHALDERHGGFFGEISHANQPNPKADKCIILNARILWFFSKAATFCDNSAYALAATRAYSYLRDYFHDKDRGGFFWSVSAEGELKDRRKHVYAEAFCIYALAAYFEFSRDEVALDLAVETNMLLHRHARDAVHGGYFESFDQNWRMNKDVRLSEKEANFPKTMNTHLHLVEALTGLVDALKTTSRDSSIEEVCLVEGIELFCRNIVDPDLDCVRMFFTEQWQDKSRSFSFGHDIESAWLLQKAANLLDKPSLTDIVQPVVRKLTHRSLTQGLCIDGRMRDEVERGTARETATAWWVQFEAMVGFAYAFRATGDPVYRTAVWDIWRYTTEQYFDNQFGEWHWFAHSDVPFRESAFKIGAWKAPYHTGRAFFELSAMNFAAPGHD